MSEPIFWIRIANVTSIALILLGFVVYLASAFESRKRIVFGGGALVVGFLILLILFVLKNI